MMADVKDSLDITIKQTFIDPLQLLQDKDLKEIGVRPCLDWLSFLPTLNRVMQIVKDPPWGPSAHWEGDLASILIYYLPRVSFCFH